ncbi:lysophospholipid acyltransferase family protein [Archangium sp.]|jgi:1-acyl-sn-glycerol-3-phosphate acyltransferase|uniref:lysophospholipid acyltransferase family protein n=1 Tax=Archangium sp. TaxID=1872627 RepID=UPI002ED91414
MLRHYLRYEVRGLERLLRPGAALLVGYHGRPLALDLCMLTVTLHEHLGQLPVGVVHGAFGHPLLRQVLDDVGFVVGEGPELAAAVAGGRHVLVQPGGTREGCRSFLHRYRVDWGERVGYLRLALEHQLPIIPVAADGVDDLYLGLNNGYALGRRLGLPARLPLWLGIGATGPWPFSLPFPVKVTQRVGQPILRHLGGRVEPEDRPALLGLHREVMGAVQELLDSGRRERAT